MDSMESDTISTESGTISTESGSTSTESGSTSTESGSTSHAISEIGVTSESSASSMPRDSMQLVTFMSPESMASDSMARASNEAKQARKLSEHAEEDEGRRACCGS